MGVGFLPLSTKGNNYDFFYRKHVIKPALIGMLALDFGGVEWNILITTGRAAS